MAEAKAPSGSAAGVSQGARSSRTRARARCRRLLIAATESPVTSATSGAVSPSTSRRRKTSRYLRSRPATAASKAAPRRLAWRTSSGPGPGSGRSWTRSASPSSRETSSGAWRRRRRFLMQWLRAMVNSQVLSDASPRKPESPRAAARSDSCNTSSASSWWRHRRRAKRYRRGSCSSSRASRASLSPPLAASRSARSSGADTGRGIIPPLPSSSAARPGRGPRSCGPPRGHP